MPKGATVIDVAFAIHEEISLTVKSAMVNGHNVTIYYRLMDSDKVTINADTYREDGVTKNSFVTSA
ncbi:MAG: TGS domain-containing protein [Clostridia bacterium]|nr:TGS domain-containing protein [Clostridia bacterium]